jgi:hypothetical protein
MKAWDIEITVMSDDDLTDDELGDAVEGAVSAVCGGRGWKWFHKCKRDFVATSRGPFFVCDECGERPEEDGHDLDCSNTKGGIYDA